MNGESFTYIDQAFAERLLINFSDQASFFLKTLFLAARQGHLCLSVKKGAVKPELFSLFGEKVDLIAIEKALIESCEALPKELFSSFEGGAPVCQWGSLFYLRRFFQAESKVLRHWKRILETEPELKFADLAIDDGLLFEQKIAVKLALEKNFIILNGGPGTGKTYTAGQMIKAFLGGLSEDAKKDFKIDLAAPTGKAAYNLEKSLKKALGGAHSFSGKTLHSLLGIKSERISLLPSDLLIVDECSMIDVEMMGSLLEAVKPGARIVLIGDQHQLPPVEAGSVFADLTNMHSHMVHLKTCMRSELKSLVDFGLKVNRGEVEEALEMMSGAVSLERIEPENVPLKNVLKEAAHCFPIEKTPEKALEAFNSFRALSPLRQGSYGVEDINSTILKEYWKRSPSSPFIAPIMISANNPKLGLFNGEVGVMVKLSGDPFTPFTAEDFALFSDGRKFYALLLPHFEYAFCLSVHKSQGSEFDHVLLILPEGSQVFGRKVVYTAVTRARKKMTLYASTEVFTKTVETNFERFSGLVERAKAVI